MREGNAAREHAQEDGGPSDHFRYVPSSVTTLRPCGLSGVVSLALHSATPDPSPPEATALKWGFVWIEFVEVLIIGHDVFPELIRPPVRGFFEKVVVIGALAGVEGKKTEIAAPFLGPLAVPREFGGTGNKAF